MSHPDVPTDFFTSIDVRRDLGIKSYTARRIIAMCPTQGIYQHPTDRNRNVSAAPMAEVVTAIDKFLNEGTKASKQVIRRKGKSKLTGAKIDSAFSSNGGKVKRTRNKVAPGRFDGGDSFSVTINGKLATRLKKFREALVGFVNTNEDVAHVLLAEALSARGF